MGVGAAARQEVEMKEPNVSLEMNSILGTEERIYHFGFNFITNGTVRSFFKIHEKNLRILRLSKIELKKITWRKFSKFWFWLIIDIYLTFRNTTILSHKLRCYTRISSPKKSRNNTREKISYFFTCVDIANQLLTRHSPLALLGQVDE